MSSERDVVSLRARVNELEARLKFLYDHLAVKYVDNPDLKNARVIELIKAGNKIEAAKAYREIHGTGLAESKEAVDRMQQNLL